MRKILSIGVNNIEKVQNENIKGIIFDLDVKDGANAGVSVLDYNQVDLKMVRKDVRGRETELFNGRLLDYLTARFAQTMLFEGAQVQYADGYKVIIPFGGTLALKGEEELLIEAYFRDATFHADLDKGNSSITMETIPSVKSRNSVLPVVKSISIGSGETSLAETIGSGVARVVIATDFTADYASSAKAKVKDCIVESGSRTVKNSSENLLIAENILLMNDVDYAPTNLVVFSADSREEILPAVTVKANFSEAVDSEARLLVTKAVRF